MCILLCKCLRSDKTIIIYNREEAGQNLAFRLNKRTLLCGWLLLPVRVSLCIT